MSPGSATDAALGLTATGVDRGSEPTCSKPLRVLCAIDAWGPTRETACFAADLSRPLGDRLSYAHVVPLGRTARAAWRRGNHGEHPDVTAAGRSLRMFARQMEARLGVRAEAIVRSGDPWIELADAAAADGTDLLVIGVDARHRPECCVSATDFPSALLARTPCPVVIVPAGVHRVAGERIVLGYDVTGPSQAAARAAGCLAARLSLPITLVHVRGPRERRQGGTGWQLYDASRRIAEAARDAGGSDVVVTVEDRGGPPAVELPSAAADGNAALVIVGSRQRRNRFGLRQSAIELEIARRTACPVLMVPAAGTDALPPRSAHP